MYANRRIITRSAYFFTSGNNNTYIILPRRVTGKTLRVWFTRLRVLGTRTCVEGNFLLYCNINIILCRYILKYKTRASKCNIIINPAILLLARASVCILSCCCCVRPVFGFFFQPPPVKLRTVSIEMCLFFTRAHNVITARSVYRYNRQNVNSEV